MYFKKHLNFTAIRTTITAISNMAYTTQIKNFWVIMNQTLHLECVFQFIVLKLYNLNFYYSCYFHQFHITSSFDKIFSITKIGLYKI